MDNEKPAASYRFENARLTPSIISEITYELFAGQVIDIRDLVDVVERHHLNHGGAPSRAQNLLPSRKKALRNLVVQGKAKRLSHGRYQFFAENTNGTESTAAEKLPSRDVADSELLHTNRQTPKAEKILGQGNEIVYLYFFSTEKELADLKGIPSWPIKIGKSAVGLSRIIEQLGTSHSAPPVIPLVLQTNNSGSLETALHRCLEFADKKINDAPGSEWFRTNVDEVEKLYEQLIALKNAT